MGDKNIIIGLAADHAGFEMKEFVKEVLRKQSYEVIDFGTNSNASCDYADYAKPLAEAVQTKEVEKGFAFCGSGNGISISLNRYSKVRSAYCWNTEIAKLARAHNDANVCSIPSRFIESEECLQIISEFLNTFFEAGRHLTRINKMEFV